MKDEVDRIYDLRSQLEVVESSFLMARCWHHTSATPDCVWMWTKEWEGKTIMVSRESALQIELNSRESL